MNFWSKFWNMAFTPTDGTDWEWFALWFGHVFFGSACATFLYTITHINPYAIDIMLFLGYAFFKEGIDLLRGGDLRDGLTDALGFGFGVYAVTNFALGSWEAACLTYLLSVLVGLYGLYWKIRMVGYV